MKTAFICAMSLFFLGCAHARPATDGVSQDIVMEPIIIVATAPEAPVEEIPVVLEVRATDEVGMFHVSRKDDTPLRMRFVLPNDTETYVDVRVKATSDVPSVKLRVQGYRLTYNQSMQVESMYYNPEETYAFFNYSGERDGFPVQGYMIISRLTEQPEYTVIIHSEWFPDMRQTMLRQIKRIKDTVVVTPRQ